MAEMTDLDVAAARRLLDNGSITASTLLSSVLERLGDTEPTLRAYASTRAPDACAEAARLDQVPRRGPLHGIPFAAKDTLAATGLPTAAGSRTTKHWHAPYEATAVTRLRDAGAVLVGKHTTHEYALGQDQTDTGNAWDPLRFPGGSSTGGATSVAVGSSMFALGTDAGGSTRMPAALNGVVGFKPTYGLVSAYGTVPGASVPELEHIGIFTTTAADARLVLDVIAGPDDLDRRTYWRPELAPSPGRGLESVRIGYIRQILTGQDIDPGVADAIDSAVDELRTAGAQVDELQLLTDMASDAVAALVGASAAANHHHTLREDPDAFSAEVRTYLYLASLIPGAHVHAARRVRARLRRQVQQAFDTSQVDVLAMPTLPSTAPLRDQFDPLSDTAPLTAFTAPWNLLGMPAISIPAGQSTDGLPTGLQIVGRPDDDALVLSVAESIQDHTTWHLARPRLHEWPS